MRTQHGDRQQSAGNRQMALTGDKVMYHNIYTHTSIALLHPSTEKLLAGASSLQSDPFAANGGTDSERTHQPTGSPAAARESGMVKIRGMKTARRLCLIAYKCG